MRGRRTREGAGWLCFPLGRGRGLRRLSLPAAGLPRVAGAVWLWRYGRGIPSGTSYCAPGLRSPPHSPMLSPVTIVL